MRTMSTRDELEELKAAYDEASREERDAWSEYTDKRRACDKARLAWVEFGKSPTTGAPDA